ncbi:hypothetical protein RND81_10G161200 [Saponaria officinalis]|uniref:RING-type domain-containing protein n=1 Tax=Saponaria officinalis TaxID=3572 RepID=A0AAW1I2Y8_SAPOF
MTTCRHEYCNGLPSNVGRVLVNLSYEEFQQTIYHDHLGDVVYEGEYRSTTPRTECVDLNPIDLDCPNCTINLYIFSSDTFRSKFEVEFEFFQEEANLSIELREKARQASRRHLTLDYLRDRRDMERVTMIEHVIERRYTKQYHQGRGGDAVAWAAALSSELATVFGRFDRVELLEGGGQVNVDKECSICLRGSGGDEGNHRSHVRLPCQHVFHGHCIATWLKKKRSCPMCRLNLVELNNRD